MNNTTKEKKFLAVIEEHKKIIYKISHSYCPFKAARKDLEQEIIIQLWNAFETYDSTYKFSTWMYRVALNVAISFYRKQYKWSAKRSPIGNTLFTIANDNDMREKEEALDTNIALLYTYINQLSELNKALMLLYLEDKSYAEIAHILGITETNVATKISRIKKKIKAQF